MGLEVQGTRLGSQGCVWQGMVGYRVQRPEARSGARGLKECVLCFFCWRFCTCTLRFFHLVTSKITCYEIVVPTRCRSDARENRYVGMDMDMYIGMYVGKYVRMYVGMYVWMYVRR